MLLLKITMSAVTTFLVVAAVDVVWGLCRLFVSAYGPIPVILIVILSVLLGLSKFKSIFKAAISTWLMAAIFSQPFTMIATALGHIPSWWEEDVVGSIFLVLIYCLLKIKGGENNE